MTESEKSHEGYLSDAIRQNGHFGLAPIAKDARALITKLYDIELLYDIGGHCYGSKRLLSDDEAAAEIERFVAARLAEHITRSDTLEDDVRRLAERAPPPNVEAPREALLYARHLLVGMRSDINDLGLGYDAEIAEALDKLQSALLSSPPSHGAKPIDDEADWS
jgi:hypothetical protein